MELIYVDESISDHWFILGAIAIDSEEWYGLEEDLLEVTNGNPLKAIRNKECELEIEECKEISHNVYENLSNLNYTAWGVIVGEAGYSNVIEAYSTALKLLYERIQIYLEKNDKIGSVFADDLGKGHEIKEVSDELKEEGTIYKSMNRVVGSISFIDDELSIGVQLADWVAAAIQAYFVQGKEEYFENISPHLDRHANTEEVAGTGIKIWSYSSSNPLTKEPNTLD